MAWTAVILAAGKGTRMTSCKPKALQTLAGRTLVEHILVKLADVAIDEVVIIHSPEAKKDFEKKIGTNKKITYVCLLYTSPSPRDGLLSRMPSSA